MRQLIIFFCTLFYVGGLPASAPNVNLTEGEIAWLKSHPVLRLAPDPEFRPIEFFDERGRYRGLAADYAKLLEQKLKIKFKIVRYKDWAGVVNGIKNKEVDVLNAVVSTPQRKKYLSFPTPYLEIPSVIIVRKNVATKMTLEKLKGMNVIMVSGYGYVDLIKNNNPELKIKLVNDLKTALYKLSFGMADAFIGDLATASYYIESYKITNLRLSGEISPQNISGFAVRSDWPELTSILSKGMALFTEQEKAAIFEKWIHLARDPGISIVELKKWIFVIVGVVTFVVLGFILWTYSLKRMVSRRTYDLSKEIQERKKAQEALKDSEVHLRTLLKTIPDLVWLKDLNGVYLSCNSRFEQFFGAVEKDILGKTDYDFVSKEIADSFRVNDQAAIDKMGAISNEEVVEFKTDGHREILETIKTPMYGNNGKLIGVLGIARDISERKQVEKERKEMEDYIRQSHKMEAMGTLAGGIAHDFNNILAAIIGYAEMVRDEVSEMSNAKSYIERVLKAGKRAKELVQHILLFSRKTERKYIPISIHSEVEDSIKLIRASIPATVEIKKNIDPTCGAVLADATQIHQVIMNLCTNAAQSMSETGGMLTITLVAEELSQDDLHGFSSLEPGHYVKLTVRDNGAGIPPQIIDKIFDPYFTTKGIGAGSGIGLSVVHGIVKNFNGAIKVESKVDFGTTFTVVLPQITAHPEEDRSQESFHSHGSERVLVVDDEEDVAELTQQRLEQLGYQVTVETSSLDALELVRAMPDSFDLIITDQTMPHMTGEQFAKEVVIIRNDLPIIICTGFSSTMDAEKASVIGIKAFIMKPIESMEFSNTVREVLDASSETH